MKYYAYDIDGCAYDTSIRITTKEINRYYYFIGCFETADKANIAASKYLFEMQKYIDVHYGGYDYEEYRDFDEFKDYIDFVDEYDNDDYDNYEDDDDDYEDDDYEDYIEE